ncbi:hypothetical protein TAMA11512_21230 [Selenomonas sp. TAMA-11512]|uniref:hypothetical protein n=1 Tax=Selenomonas sp. TAMA-11512 TaxID=3095337 RepID=UPI00308495C3|nr:hypothetical protein TAMA11512_09330 [Selenomonas sp. TAMA-11512]BEU88659.1 hypothetical protein TAMA11512_21230 [Selenomonas sp. TAMA-11512]
MRNTGKKQGRATCPPFSNKPEKEGTKLNDKPFRWKFSQCFWEHKGWKSVTTIQDFHDRIIAKLKDFESMVWQEILDASGGKSKGNGNNHHFIMGNKLPKEEGRAFIEKGYMERYEKVFSLRLSGRERLIGIVDGGMFCVLWFDPDHVFF